MVQKLWMFKSRWTKTFVQFYTMKSVKQWSSTVVLRAHCPACSRCFCASTHQIQMNGRYQASAGLDNNPFIWIKCVRARKHNKLDSGPWGPGLKSTGINLNGHAVIFRWCPWCLMFSGWFCDICNVAPSWDWLQTLVSGLLTCKAQIGCVWGSSARWNNQGRALTTQWSFEQSAAAGRGTDILHIDPKNREARSYGLRLRHRGKVLDLDLTRFSVHGRWRTYVVLKCHTWHGMKSQK